MTFKKEFSKQLETFTDKNFVIPVILADIALIPILLSNSLASNITDALLKVIAIDLVLITAYLLLWTLIKYIFKFLFTKLFNLLKLLNKKINPYYRIKKLEEQVGKNERESKEGLIIPVRKVNPSELKKEISKLDQNLINLIKYLIEERFIFMWDIKKMFNLSFAEFYNIFQDLSMKGIFVSDSKPLHRSSLIKLNPNLLEHEDIVSWLINDEYKK